jgi:hypothetical protein
MSHRIFRALACTALSPAVTAAAGSKTRNLRGCAG